MDEERDWALENFRNHDRRADALEAAALDSATQALKALLLLNGGACIALLGFLSSTYNANEVGADGTDLALLMLDSLSKFAWGAGLAVLASGIAYLTNSYYARGLMSKKKQWMWPYIVDTEQSGFEWKIGRALNVISVLLSIFSFVLFCTGLYVLRFAY